MALLPTLVERADCVVTSPPYWGLRDYGIEPTDWPEVRYAPMAGLPQVVIPEQSACLGLESDPLAYVGHLVEVMRHVRGVLKATATVWLNLGDTYVGGRNGGIGASSITSQRSHRAVREAWLAHGGAMHRRVRGLKAKDLIGIPWRAALALQADGWWLRSEVVWHKPSPLPESVRDRPTRAHEHVFLLTTRRRGYYYDADAISERGTEDPERWARRNARTVWTIAQVPEMEAHTATFPPELARRCILAGCPPEGLVLDPFAGLATTGVVALRHGRRFLGIEKSEAFSTIARRRLVEALEAKGEGAAEMAKVKGAAVQLGMFGGAR